MKDQPQHLHKGGAEPIVIHHESDETILAQWLKKALKKGPGFWLMILGGTALGLALVIGMSAWANRPSPDAKAWIDVMIPSAAPKDLGSTKYEGMPVAVRPLLALADQAPTSPASRWAILRAATLLYEEGLRDLPNQREAARPTLQQAIEQFDRVLALAPPDAPEALIAASGKARALETRGELDDAIKQYQEVARRWPGSPQAKAAEKRAKELAEPSVRKFYEDFYTLDLSKVPALGGTLPGDTGLPGSAFGTPLVPSLGDLPPLTGSGALTPGPATPPTMTPGGEFPKDLFAPESPGGEPVKSPETDQPISEPSKP